MVTNELEVGNSILICIECPDDILWCQDKKYNMNAVWAYGTAIAEIGALRLKSVYRCSCKCKNVIL